MALFITVLLNPETKNSHEEVCAMHIRGLGFKFVDILCKRSNVCHTEIKML